MKPDFCEDRADWLVDAVACATQNRMFLRGDEDADPVVIEALYLNGLKALRAAYAAGLERAAEIADEQADCSRQERSNASAMNDRTSVRHCEYEIVAVESVAASIRAEKEKNDD